LRGFRVGLDGASSRWRLFGGKPKYVTEALQAAGGNPRLFGAQYLRTVRGVRVGGSVTFFHRVPPGEIFGPLGRERVITVDYSQRLFGIGRLWAELLSTGSGDPGLRGGARFDLGASEISASIYGFGGSFPDLAPLYRPDERGVQFAGRFRPGSAWSLFGSLDYVADSPVERRARFRGDAGVGWRPGAQWPYVQLPYYRSREAMDSTSIAAPATTADRLAFLLSHSTAAEFVNLDIEHVFGDPVSPQRSQAYLAYRRVLGHALILDGSLLAQRGGDSDAGYNVESSVERQIRGSLGWLAGLGATYIDRAKGNNGEGVARIGLALRPTRGRVQARVELRLPFDIGLARSGTSARGISFDIGTRFGWNDLRPSPRGPRGERQRTYGTIEGRVVLQGDGLEGLPVLIDGEVRDVTDADGSFRIRRVETGAVTVTLDVRRLDTRYIVLEGFSRGAVVEPGATSRLQFDVAPFSYFQGSLVRCDGQEIVPLGGARITLHGEGYRRTVFTSRIGGFQFDDIPPATYVLVVEPDGEPAGTYRFDVDLNTDLAGHVITLGCDAPPR
jgi:hypothetical protein